MTTITFIEHNGRRHVVQAPDGQSLMRAAVANGVPGIDAECGGACACATCHVYIAPAWHAHVGPPQGHEKEMLDFALDVRSSSRLACQVMVSPRCEGLEVALPVAQS